MRDVSKLYGDKVVLEDITLSFFYGAKIGVVGENGAGKSTLLKIMAGIDRDIHGTATLAKGMSVRYVAQEPQLELDKTVRDNLRTAMKPIQDLVDRFNAISDRMGAPPDGDDMDKLLEEMGKLQEKIDAADGWEMDRLMDIAPPRGLVHGPAGKARPAASGRAHQPPRRRDGPVAGAGPARVPRHGHHRYA